MRNAETTLPTLLACLTAACCVLAGCGEVRTRPSEQYAWQRCFSNNAAILNTSQECQTVIMLKGYLSLYSDSQATLHELIIDDDNAAMAFTDAWSSKPAQRRAEQVDPF
jgi:hypothetical protein